MSGWKIVFISEAEKDLERLDNSQVKPVLKAIYRVSQNPLPDFKGGYGKPLGNKGGINLSGYMKIKLRQLGLRVVYSLEVQETVMLIIIISVRDDEMVYKLAQTRLK